MKNNPFNITENEALSAGHSLPNLRSVFAMELRKTAQANSHIIAGKMDLYAPEIVSQYAIDMIKSYYENAGFVPMCIVDAITTQVSDAADLVFDNINYSPHSSLKTLVLSKIYQ